MERIAHFQLTELIAESNSALVYRANDLKLGRSVVLKLNRAMMPGSDGRQIFEEARKAAAICHPSVAVVYEVGEANGWRFAAMEHVEGDSLEARLDQGPLPLSEAVNAVIQIASALESAHSRGIIHCDLKGANLIRTPAGMVKLIDFGLARWLSEDGTSALRKVSGSPYYMSPEQVRGEPLDPRSDLFSLGVLLYQMVAGRRPFEGEGTAEVLAAILREEPPPLNLFNHEAPLELESVVRKALAKKREDRYQTASEVCRDLERVESLLGQVNEARKLSQPGSQNEGSDRAERAGERSILAGRLVPILVTLVCFLPILLYAKWWPAAAALFGLVWLVFERIQGGRRRSPTASVLVKGVAFRGLAPFNEADRGRFFGRTPAVSVLFEMLTRPDFRYGVLFGESGCGKTSLLRAGLVPRLWEEGLAPIYCPSSRDPLAAIFQECRKRSRLVPGEAELPDDYLRRVCSTLGGDIVVILDQFEEFFAGSSNRSERQAFLNFLAGRSQDVDHPVRFLFSIRNDALYLIATGLGEVVRDPLRQSQLHHLRSFDEEEASELMDRLAHEANLGWAPGLARRLAADLAHDSVVQPSELQILGQRIQQKGIRTVEVYRRAGGREVLVHGYLQDVIQASGDPDLARQILQSLITEDDRRAILTRDEIIHRTLSARRKVDRILNLFADARLLRLLHEDGRDAYELMHDYLVQLVNRVTGQKLDATQKANRLLRQYVAQSEIERRALIPIRQLWFITRYSDSKRGENELEVLRRSLRRGILKVVASTMAISCATLAVSAWFSVAERWEGRVLRDGHTSAVRSAAVSPDGRFLLTGGDDRRLILWDLTTRTPRWSFPTDTWISSADFSLDGKHFAFVVLKVGAFVGEIPDPKSIFKLQQCDAAGSVSFSVDGRLLAVARHLQTKADAYRADIWETGTWRKLQSLPHNYPHIPARFLSSSMVRTSEGLFDPLSGRQLGRVGLETLSCSSNREGTRGISVNSAGVVTFRDLTTGRVISETRAHHGHGTCAIYRPDGRYAVSGADKIVLWNGTTFERETVFSYPSMVWSLNFLPDGNLVSTHVDGAILLWDIEKRELMADLNGHSAAVTSVGFSPSGRRLASAGRDGSIIIWDSATGRKETVLIGHQAPVMRLAYSPREDRLASIDFNNNVFEWDTVKGKIARIYPVKDPEPCCGKVIAWSPGGRWLVLNNWVLDTHAELAASCKPIPYGANVYGVAFDGPNHCALVDDSGFLTAVDCQTAAVTRQSARFEAALTHVVWSPEHRLFVAGSDNGLLCTVDAGSFAVEKLGRWGGKVAALAIAPDYSTVAFASDDGRVRFWDLGRRRITRQIGFPEARVSSLSFSPDGNMLAAGDGNGTVRILRRSKVLWNMEIGR